MGEPRARPVVTIDGPAGSGKSSTAREVARRMGFRHLDSGALYRGLALALHDTEIPSEQWPAMSDASWASLGVGLRRASDGFRVRVGDREVDRELRTPEVTERASWVARIPAARALVLATLRAAGAAGGVVADGRDMGTVVFPDAEVKVYLVANLEERARRRLREIGIGEPGEEELAGLARSLGERDRRDEERELSPLRRPEGSHVIDTTTLGFEEQVDAIIGLIRRLTPS